MAHPITTALRHRAEISQNIRTVNELMPEQNGGVATITKITDVPIDGFLRQVYCLAVNADIRYALHPRQVWYKAFVHGTDEVLLQHPSLPYTDLFEHESYARGRITANITDPRHVQAEAVLRNALLTNPDRQMTTVCFKFAQALDNDVCSPNAAENRIRPRVIPDIPAGVGAIVHQAKVYFLIAIEDPNPPRIEAPVAPTSDNELMALLSGMNIGTGAP